jgi:hypothetical protein
MTAPVGLARGGRGHSGGGAQFSGMSPRSGASFGRGGGHRWSGGGTRNWSGARNSSGRNWSGRNWSGNRNWSGRSWNGRNWNGRHWNGRKWCNNVVFIGDFGFPYWWGLGWGYPYGYYGYGYPYDYYGGGYGYGYDGYGNDGYGYDYGRYGDSSRSRVAELQRRLARAGYYRGAIDGVLGPQTRRAIRAYESSYGEVSMR